ncbi:hypothetical protein [Helicobacter suis]|uniref:hypothetical protein n=1 Tax=Helicobacter suis TaxID=104628 RepID=UPI0013D5FB0B|nr:hypothetical protein [Helicobacter suis]
MNWEKIGLLVLENVAGGVATKAGEWLGERVFGSRANNTVNRVNKYSKHRKLGVLINQYGQHGGLAKAAFEYERQRVIIKYRLKEGGQRKGGQRVINAIRNNQQRTQSGYFVGTGLNKRRRRRWK